MGLNPKHAATAVAGLEAYIASLEQQQTDIAQKIAESREALKAMQKQCANGGTAAKERRKKGENLRELREVLKESAVPMTASDLAAKLGVPQSSIHNVLKKHTEEFGQVSGGLWEWKGAA